MSLSGQVIVFTGFRDESLKTLLERAGASVKTAISGQTTMLVKNDNTKSSQTKTKVTAKVQAAIDRGVRIVTRSEIMSMASSAKNSASASSSAIHSSASASSSSSASAIHSSAKSDNFEIIQGDKKLVKHVLLYKFSVYRNFDSSLEMSDFRVTKAEIEREYNVKLNIGDSVNVDPHEDYATEKIFFLSPSGKMINIQDSSIEADNWLEVPIEITRHFDDAVATYKGFWDKEVIIGSVNLGPNDKVVKRLATGGFDAASTTTFNVNLVAGDLYSNDDVEYDTVNKYSDGDVLLTITSQKTSASFWMNSKKPTAAQVLQVFKKPTKTTTVANNNSSHNSSSSNNSSSNSSNINNNITLIIQLSLDVKDTRGHHQSFPAQIDHNSIKHPWRITGKEPSGALNVTGPENDASRFIKSLHAHAFH